MTGRWSQLGVPHKGWSCVDMIDVADDLITCQMCDLAQVRYVHEMSHPDYPEKLLVGCHCAARMESIAALARETAFKRMVRNPKRWKVVAECDGLLGRDDLCLADRLFVEGVRKMLATTRRQLDADEYDRLAWLRRGAERGKVERSPRAREPSPEAISWIGAADRLLVCGLIDRERAFVEDIRRKFILHWDFVISPKQTSWFVSLYRKHVQAKKEQAA